MRGLMGDMTHSASCRWGLPRGRSKRVVRARQRGQHANFDLFDKKKKKEHALSSFRPFFKLFFFSAPAHR